MNCYDPTVAAANLQGLSQNPYPGRGIVIGLDETGTYVLQIYWIMGRSQSSRNRIFVKSGKKVSTQAADSSLVNKGDRKLIIYTAMTENADDNWFLVSNGRQTNALASLLNDDDKAPDLRLFMYEPDAPNFTPRITGISILPEGRRPLINILSVFTKGKFGCDRHTYQPDRIEPGFGFGVTTYSGDGNPLPSFKGGPILLPLTGSADELIANTYWQTLNEENRVSLVLRSIRIKDGKSSTVIINKYQKVPRKAKPAVATT